MGTIWLKMKLVINQKIFRLSLKVHKYSTDEQGIEACVRSPR